MGTCHNGVDNVDNEIRIVGDEFFGGGGTAEARSGVHYKLRNL